MESEPQDSKYQAFISYSRRADGELVAPALQRGLQGFAKPWYRLRALRVFRDDDNLSANPAIWPSVQEALDVSEHFILLASPESAQSEWVGQELQHWLASHDAQKLLLVQTDGAEIAWDAGSGDFAAQGNDAVPEALLGVFSDEPRFVDLRWARERDQISLADPRFRDAVADIAAPLRGVPKDEIVGEHVRQHRRARRTAIAGASALAVLTAVAVAFGILALVSRQQAVDREQETASVLLGTSSGVALDSNPLLALQLAVDGHDVRQTSASDLAVREATARPQPSVELALGIGRQEHAAFSHDGERVASAGRDGVLRIWSVDAGRDQTPVEYAAIGTPINSVDFSPDGSLVAVSGGDGLVLVWELDDGTDAEPRRFEGHMGSVNSVEFSPDSTTIVTAGFDRTVRTWRVDGNKSPAVRRDAGSESFLDAAFSPDGRTIAGAGEDGGIRVWPASRPAAAPRVLRAGDDGSMIDSVAFDPSGQRVAGAGLGGLNVWDLSGSPNEATALTGHLGPLESVAFTPDGARLVSGARDRTARVWDLGSADQQAFLNLSAHRGDVTEVDVSPDGRQIVTTGSDGRVFLWEADGYPGQSVSRWRDDPGLVSAIALDREGGQVASGGFAGPIHVRDTDSDPKEAPLRLSGHEGGTSSVAFDDTGRSLVSGGRDGLVRGWDLDAGADARPFVFRGHDSTVQSVAVSDAGERIVSGGGAGQVRAWDTSVNGPAEPLELEAGDETIFGTAISRDGRWVAAAGVDRVVRVWDLETPATLTQPYLFLGAEDDLFSVEFSPDAGKIAAGGEDGGVRIWEVVPSGSDQPEVLGAHDGWVTAMDFTDDGTRLFSASNDGTVRIWDVSAGSRNRPVVLEPRPTGTPIFAGDINADASVLAVGGGDVQVRECAACSEDIGPALDLARALDVSSLDEADRERAFGG